VVNVDAVEGGWGPSVHNHGAPAPLRFSRTAPFLRVCDAEAGGTPNFPTRRRRRARARSHALALSPRPSHSNDPRTHTHTHTHTETHAATLTATHPPARPLLMEVASRSPAPAAAAAAAAPPAPSLLPAPPASLWSPSLVFGPARPPPQDDRSQLAYQAELAFRQSHQSEFNNRDYSNSSKKLRARRTIDYFGEMGKWTLVRPLRRGGGGVPLEV